jgi:hypothetical protein
MGEFCVEHEQQRQPLGRRHFQRLLSATAVVAVASVGAILTRTYWR